MRRPWKSGRSSREDHPGVTEHQNGLARSHNNLGILLSETGQPSEAREAYEAALAIWQKLAEGHPTVTAYQSNLAASHANLGQPAESDRPTVRGAEGSRDGPSDPAEAREGPPDCHRKSKQPGG